LRIVRADVLAVVAVYVCIVCTYALIVKSYFANS
jgi:hypothetical protein